MGVAAWWILDCVVSKGCWTGGEQTHVSCEQTHVSCECSPGFPRQVGTGLHWGGSRCGCGDGWAGWCACVGVVA